MTDLTEPMFYKSAFTMRLSEEMMADVEGFRQKGHLEPVTPTPEQVAQHARATELVNELEDNPYIRISGYDGELDVEPLETDRWVADESHEEFMARYRAHRNSSVEGSPS